MRQQSEQHAQALAALGRGFDRQREIDAALSRVETETDRSLSLDNAVGAMAAQLAHAQRAAQRQFQSALDVAETDWCEPVGDLKRQIFGMEIKFAAARSRVVARHLRPSFAGDPSQQVAARCAQRRYPCESHVVKRETDTDLRALTINGRGERAAVELRMHAHAR